MLCIIHKVNGILVVLRYLDTQLWSVLLMSALVSTDIKAL